MVYTENIAFGVPVECIDHKEFLGYKNIDWKTICKWKENYQTVVGEREQPVYGQRQRIGIVLFL